MDSKRPIHLPFYLSKYPILAQISGNMRGWLESKEQLLSQFFSSSCRANFAEALKPAMEVKFTASLLFPQQSGANFFAFHETWRHDLRLQRSKPLNWLWYSARLRQLLHVAFDPVCLVAER